MWKQGLTLTQASALNVTIQSCRSFHTRMSHVGLCVCTQDEQKREEKKIQIVKQGTLLGVPVFQQ